MPGGPITAVDSWPLERRLLFFAQEGLCHTERALSHDGSERQCNAVLKAVMVRRIYE